MRREELINAVVGVAALLGATSSTCAVGSLIMAGGSAAGHEYYDVLKAIAWGILAVVCSLSALVAINYK